MKTEDEEPDWPQRAAGSFTQVDGELDPASVQLQAQRVGRLLRGGGHQQPEGPLRHEAQGHVLRLRVQRPGKNHLQVHAAVEAHRGRLWGGGFTTVLFSEAQPTS